MVGDENPVEFGCPRVPHCHRPDCIVAVLIHPWLVVGGPTLERDMVSDMNFGPCHVQSLLIHNDIHMDTCESYIDNIYHHVSSNNINKYDMIWFWYVTVSASLILGHDISRHWWPYSFRHIRNNKWLMLSCSACHDPSETNVVSIRVSNWKALRSVPPNPLNFSPPMIRVGW